MKRMFEKLGHYTKMYKLEGGKRKDRYINYNDILFENIEDISKGQQVIVLNEEMSGGVIYGNGKYSKVALDKLRKQLSKYKIDIISTTKADGGYTKISFSIKEKEAKGWDKLNKY